MMWNAFITFRYFHRVEKVGSQIEDALSWAAGESLKPHKLQSALFPPSNMGGGVNKLRFASHCKHLHQGHKSVDVGRNLLKERRRQDWKKENYFSSAGKNEYSSACVHSSEQ